MRADAATFVLVILRWQRVTRSISREQIINRLIDFTAAPILQV